MQSFQQENNNQDTLNKNPSHDEEITLKSASFGKLALSPFLVNTLESSDFVFASYCPRHNMIIACFFDCAIEFYNATTLMPLDGRKKVQLDGYVTCMSYSHEIDTFIFVCGSGALYTYNADSEELKKLRKCECVRVATYLNSRFYAFGISQSRELVIGSLDNDNLNKVNSGNSDCMTLEYLSKRNLLLSSFENGFVRIYRTDKPPHLRNLCSIKASPAAGQWVAAIEIINVNGKELIVTSGRDCTVKIWHLVKGRMRLLRVIKTEGVAYWFVYLENYKMIATVYDRSNEIKFWSVLSGKLEKTFVCEKNKVIWNLFLMKDKNIIGAIGGTRVKFDFIEFIQLHPPGEKY